MHQPAVRVVRRFDDSVLLGNIEEHRADQLACAVAVPPVRIPVLVPVENEGLAQSMIHRPHYNLPQATDGCAGDDTTEGCWLQ